MVKLFNAPALKREMVVHEEGEIIPTKQDLMIEVETIMLWPYDGPNCHGFNTTDALVKGLRCGAIAT